MDWIAGWSNRLPLTISGSNITENAVDFPMMIYLDYTCSGIFTELGDNSKKISLRLEDYTECYVEVESWDSSIQKAVLWAKMPTLTSGTDVNMYLFYDNNHENNTSYVGLTTETAAKAVWDSSYKCVLHFAQTPAGAGSVKDSTTNANHGLPGATATLVDGEFGKAYDFDGSTTGYVRVTDHTSLDFTTALTFTIFYCLDAAIEGLILTKNTTGSTYAYGMYVQSANKIATYAGQSGGWTPTFIVYDDVVPVAGVWAMSTGVYNGTNLKNYKNGVYKNVSGDNVGSLYDSAGDLWICYNSEFSKQIDGKVAFVSLAAVARTEAYLLLTYKSLRNQLITIGAEETAPGPSLAYRQLKLSILNTNVDADLTNFPVLVHLSSSCGANSFSAFDVFTALESDVNRKKFVITTVSGNLAAENQCAVEIERWDTANSEAWLWVKVPTVSSGAVTTLYMYYGSMMEDNINVGDTNSAAARNVWDSNFVAVYHCGQDPSGGSGAILDSTANVNHGTSQGTMLTEDLVSAKIGKGYDLDGSNDYIQMPAGTSCKGDTKGTIECLIYTRATPASNAGLIYESTGATGYSRQGIFWFTSTDQISLSVRDSESSDSFAATTALAVSKNAWHHIVGVNDSVSDVQYLYIDSAISGSNVSARGAYTSTTAADPMGFGAYTFAGGFRSINAIMDEVRISDTARSTSWVKATYYSNIDNLIEFGPIEDYSPYYFSGTVLEGSIPVDRSIYAYRHDTGALIGLTTSVSGVFYLTTTYSGSHFLVCLDTPGGSVYNLLGYDLMYPGTI